MLSVLGKKYFHSNNSLKFGNDQCYQEKNVYLSWLYIGLYYFYIKIFKPYNFYSQFTYVMTDIYLFKFLMVYMLYKYFYL